MKRKHSEIYDSENKSFSDDEKLNFNIDKLKEEILKGVNSKGESVKTYCRIRPIENNSGLFTFDLERKNLTVKNDPNVQNFNLNSEKNSFNFTKIFDLSSTQFEVFMETCYPLVNDLVNNRKSGLIFAYGLTNAGKTYTIIGEPQNPGVLPLTLKYITDLTKNAKFTDYPNSKIELFCNYVEIYNEEVFDLLSNEGTKKEKGKKKVYIKEKDKVFFIQNVTNKKVEVLEHFNDAFNIGIMKKTHASTNLNVQSSRSHTIFKVLLRFYREANKEEYQEASLSIVDLAGSERSTRAETSGKELQQACKINQSLSVLGKCIEAMRANSIFTNKKLVPFRESKLTMLFQEYFQGEQNVIMIANINPRLEDYEETIRVINYSCSARDIKPARSKVLNTNQLFNTILSMRRKEKLSNISENLVENENESTGIFKSGDEMNFQLNNFSNSVRQSEAFSSDILFNIANQNNNSIQEGIIKLILIFRKIKNRGY